MSLAWTALLELQTEASAILTEREVSAMTGVSISTLRYLWLTGAGPEYTEEYGAVRCTVESVLKWNAQRRADHARLMASYNRRQS